MAPRSKSDPGERRAELREISIVLYPQALTSSVCLPLEMFQATNELLRARRRGAETVSVRFVGMNTQPVRLMGGVSLTPEIECDKSVQNDLVILPAIWRNPLQPVRHMEGLLDWIERQCRGGARVIAAGSASFLLAERGLLRSQPATTHWYYFEMFSRRYPDVFLKRDHLITKSGAIFCVGSVNALADMVVQLVRESFGALIAEALEGQFSPEIRKPIRDRLYDPEQDNPLSDDAMVDAQRWLRMRCGEEVSISRLASELGMTVRSLNRRFRNACGGTPSNYLTALRMENAKELLKASNLSVTEIGVHVGYSNVSHFSAMFKRWIGTSPTSYRTQVRKKLFGDAEGQAASG